MYTRQYDRPVTIYLDQDGPLADFQSAANAAGWEPKVAKMKRGFYRSLPLTPGAKEAVEELLRLHHLQVFVATKIPDRNPYAATEKILWLNEHLPGMGERIIITPNKACLGTPDDFLVDDRAHKADASFFRGTFIHFGSPAYPDWAAVMKRLRKLDASLAGHSSAPSAAASRATVTAAGSGGGDPPDPFFRPEESAG
jgi:5'-nucleotidase